MVFPRTPRRLELLAVLYLAFVGAVLLTAAFADPLNLGVVWSALAGVGGVAVIFLPWAPGARTRAVLVAALTLIMALRAVVSLFLGLWMGVFVWSALLTGVILLISRDQDVTFKDKTP